MSRLILAVLTLTLPTTVLDARHVEPDRKSIDRKPACDRPSSRVIGANSREAGIHKLGDMPPAKQYLTVLREIDGCPEPVVLREGIGG